MKDDEVCVGMIVRIADRHDIIEPFRGQLAMVTYAETTSLGTVWYLALMDEERMRVMDEGEALAWGVAHKLDWKLIPNELRSRAKNFSPHYPDHSDRVPSVQVQRFPRD